MEATQLAFPVVLRSAGPDDEQLLADLLAGLSPASAFHRFMAGVGKPNPEHVRALLRTDGCRGAVLALRRHPAGVRALGHACWAVDGSGVADLGVLVTGEAQGRGLGTALLADAASRAAAAGATRVHLDVHPDNRRVAAALRRRLGPGALAWQEGLLSVDVPLADVLRNASPADVTVAA